MFLIINVPVTKEKKNEIHFRIFGGTNNISDVHQFLIYMRPYTPLDITNYIDKGVWLIKSKDLIMFFKAETKPRFRNCPRCESTDTFLSAFMKKRFCVNCRKLYDKTDETRLRKQKMDVAYGLYNPSNVNVTVLSSNEIPPPV